MIQEPAYQDKAELFRWLKANKHLLITEKKAQIKRADPVAFQHYTLTSTGSVEKAQANPDLLKLDEFNVKVVINTTNIRDSHKDVHLPGLWKKSLSEQKIIYLLQEHQMKFDHIISDRVQASSKTLSWAELGFNYPGTTEALVFDATVEKERNPYMAEQYAKARVKNHSVGMQYVKLDLAMNSDDKFDQEEKAVWDKYIDQVVNKDEVMEDGYFWAVTEAKVIEGSAVPLGSNYATPTLSTSEKTMPLDTADPITEPTPVQWGKLAQAIKQSLT